VVALALNWSKKNMRDFSSYGAPNKKSDYYVPREALITKAAKYGKQLGVTVVWLVLFVEAVDDQNRQRFEMVYTDQKTGVVVHPLFVQTGSLV
jgi:hypothetical protein